MHAPLALILMLSAAPAHPEAGWATVHVPSEVGSGTTLEIEIGETPRDVEEFELLLSLDDGRTWPVRASRDLEAGERVIRWRVPNLPAASARLRLRFERGGREIEGPASAAFRIAGGDGPQELRTFHEGNWWEGFESLPVGSRSEMNPGGVPVLSSGSATGAFEAAGPGTLLEGPRESRSTPDRNVDGSPHPYRPLSPLKERSLPLRN
jgi:hypothetical protein